MSQGSAMSAFRSIISRLSIGNAIFFVCDIQARFRPLIYNAESIIATTSFLNKALKTLEVPCIVTEQYTKAFGNTVEEIELFPTTKVFEKKQFSMLVDEVETELVASGRKQVIMCGIESHVCVMQSTLDLIDKGYEVHLVCDGVSSMRSHDRTVALQRLRDSGATLTTAESLLFDLLRSPDHPQFKAVSNLIKERQQLVNDFASHSTL